MIIAEPGAETATVYSRTTLAWRRHRHLLENGDELSSLSNSDTSHVSRHFLGIKDIVSSLLRCEHDYISAYSNNSRTSSLPSSARDPVLEMIQASHRNVCCLPHWPYRECC